MTTYENIPEANEPSRHSTSQRYPVDASCFEDAKTRSAAEGLLGETLRLLGILRFDLEALDGATLARDCRATAIAIQKPPDPSCVPEHGVGVPNTFELGRTIAVRRGNELRFHIVLYFEIGEMLLSDDEQRRALAMACIAHELAHVQHEGRFYRKFPHLFEGPLECGERKRSIFIRSMDVWSEYAACRSSAAFRPEALEEHQLLLKGGVAKYLATEHTAPIEEREAVAVETLLCAGYLLGEVDGLDLEIELTARESVPVIHDWIKVSSAFDRLKRILRELWDTEEYWTSIEVFAPIYELAIELR
ncbi:MAG: hypothetical protein PW792_10645 [Acidobacteriaceae bacterium]|nr:hypothetical protein [Acidobacteriaceae bacterium]